MKKAIVTHFRQKRKTLYKRNVLGTFFRPESQKREFSTFGSKNVKMSSFFASGALLAPKTLQNAKVGPKVKKAVLGVLGSKNVPRTLRFSLFRARSENDAFSSFALFCAFSLFGRKSSFWPPKVVKTAQNAKHPPFCAFLRKWPPKYLKKHCLQKGLRDGRKMNAPGAKKRSFLQNSALWRPKRVLGAFCCFERKKSGKSILGDIWLQKRAQMLMFSTVWRSGWKIWFLLKSCCSEKKKQ